MTEEVQQKLQNMVNSHDVVLFMKGDRQQPQCGFSARVVGILEDLEIEYQTFNVFSDPDIRSGMKDFSQWPTFPQLYIKQEFIGGCDIVTDLMQSGELPNMLGVNLEAVPVPTIHLSPSITQLFKESISQHGGGIHLTIPKDFQYDIAIGPKQGNQMEVIVDDIPFYLTRGSAQRANGLSLDFRDGEGGGVMIENPNEPKFSDLDVHELTTWLAETPDAKLYQIGTDADDVHPNATLLTATSHQEIQQLATDHPIAFICNHGVRSAQAAKSLAFQGYTNVINVMGGMSAWKMLQ